MIYPVLFYNSFDFFYQIWPAHFIHFFEKNEKCKVILEEVYYMINDITVKFNNNYDFLISSQNYYT
jgi:hypothetical protein